MGFEGFPVIFVQCLGIGFIDCPVKIGGVFRKGILPKIWQVLLRLARKNSRTLNLSKVGVGGAWPEEFLSGARDESPEQPKDLCKDST